MLPIKGSYQSKPLQLPDVHLAEKVAACEKNTTRINAEMAAFNPTEWYSCWLFQVSVWRDCAREKWGS